MLLSQNDFYEVISKSKFAICPRGCGIDTYRLWDCICLGCIPIVEKYDGHHRFKELPILFLDDINSFHNLTEEWLHMKYEEFMKRDFDYSLLFMDKLKEEIHNTYSKITNLSSFYMKTPDFGAYLQCHKNPMATFMCLQSFRTYYPNATIVLLSDNGYDYTEMAKLFHCIYIHETENIWFTYNDLENEGYIVNSNKLVKRICDAFRLYKENYVMWLEDDVSINKPITDVFRYDINGFCPNAFDRFANMYELKQKYPQVDYSKTLVISGHGGSVYHRQNMISYFENKETTQDLLLHWKKYKFPSNIGHDYLFSMIAIFNGGTIGPYDGHTDYFHEINKNIAVQHQYKKWYGVELPQELKHLVTMN
jgi:hypothetical protein